MAVRQYEAMQSFLGKCLGRGGAAAAAQVALRAQVFACYFVQAAGARGVRPAAAVVRSSQPSVRVVSGRCGDRMWHLSHV